MTTPKRICNLTGETPSELEPVVTESGLITLAFTADPGLYQLSVVIDASTFDWETLYEDLTNYGNHGQRTGPWDFKLGSSKALVPSYWVTVDGRFIGLWYFQRVNLADIEAKRFRGRMAFHLAQEGEHELRLEPYNYPEAVWLASTLEADPVDHLEPLPATLRQAPGQLPAARWQEVAYWDHQRRALAGDLACYATPLREALHWAMHREDATDNRAVSHLDVPLLAAAWFLDHQQEALDRALRLLDEAIEREHWGNQAPDGYGHDGDMGTALLLNTCTWAWHAMAAELGEDRRARLLAKLHLQGQRFFQLTLLNRDYWGGSVLQDHGWRSMWLFGTIALRLHGVVPEAETWLRYLLPRLRQCLQAMPRDGIIPRSSHLSVYLYLDELSQFRHLLLTLGGPDIYDQGPFPAIIDYVWEVMRGCDREQLTSGDLGFFSLIGGVTFFNHMAAKHGSSRAARIHHLLLNSACAPHHMQTRGTTHHHPRFWGFFQHRPVPSLPAPVAPERRRLLYYEDAALVLVRDDDLDLSLQVQCGPWCGYNAYRRAAGPCDRMTMAPTAGTFTLQLQGVPVITMADSGYKLQTASGSTLLIDGEGQLGDIGYPMSIPDYPDTGVEIRKVSWDHAAGTGFIRLVLHPAYPARLGLISYTRDLLIRPGCHLTVRDTILLHEPRHLTWLFHADQKLRLSMDGLTGKLGGPPAMTVEAQCTGASLTGAIGQIDQVYSYSSSRPIHQHFRYETDAPAAHVCAQFDFTWKT